MNSTVFLSTKESGDVPPRGGLNGEETYQSLTVSIKVLDSAVFLSTKESGDIPPRGGLNGRRHTKVSQLV
jgi:hypothetical protein